MGIVEVDGQMRLKVVPCVPEDEMESGLLLDVVIAEGAAILELLPGEDETLLIHRNALFVLNELK